MPYLYSVALTLRQMVQAANSGLVRVAWSQPVISRGADGFRWTVSPSLCAGQVEVERDAPERGDSDCLDDMPSVRRLVTLETLEDAFSALTWETVMVWDVDVPEQAVATWQRRSDRE